MKLWIARLYRAIKSYFAKCCNPRAQLPEKFSDNTLIDYMSEMERSGKNGRF